MERGLIGAIMVDPEAYKSVANFVSKRMFSDAQYGIVYGHLTDMLTGGVPLDLITTPSYLEKKGFVVEEIRVFLADAMKDVGHASIASYYGKKIAEAYYDRMVMEEALRLAKDKQPERLAKINSLIQAKEALTGPQAFNYKTGLYDLVDGVVKQAAGRLYKTHIPSIDACWRGSRAGEVNTIGAATNTGKSILMLNLMNLSAKNGDRCLFVGTEMTAQEITERHLAMVSGVPAWKVRTGRVDLTDISTMNDGAAKMSELPIEILDHPEPRIRDIDQAISASKPEIVFIDYLDRLNLPDAESHRLRIKEGMKQIKTLARARNVVVYIAAQLSREAYAAVERRPVLSDLSESKAIETESDRVLLVWRPKDKQIGQDAVLEIISAKNRKGSRGEIFDLVLNERTLTLSERG